MWKWFKLTIKLGHLMYYVKMIFILFYLFISYYLKLLKTKTHKSNMLVFIFIFSIDFIKSIIITK